MTKTIRYEEQDCGDCGHAWFHHGRSADDEGGPCGVVGCACAKWRGVLLHESPR